VWDRDCFLGAVSRGNQKARGANGGAAQAGAKSKPRGKIKKGGIKTKNGGGGAGGGGRGGLIGAGRLQWGGQTTGATLGGVGFPP